MGETGAAAERLRAYQAQEQRFVERRFPLQFAPEVPAIRELYSQAKGFRWNPMTDIAWDRFDPARYSKETCEAARRIWSRRAWGVYPGLTESTALRLIAGDRQRHVAFAWMFLGSRVPALDERGRRAVVDAVHDMLAGVILAGYRNTWLLPAASRERWLAVEEATARAGLGASTAAQERSVLRATVAQVRERFATWKLEVPRVSHPELGAL